MSDPRQTPFPEFPAWNEQALEDFARYIAREGEVTDDLDSADRDAPGLRWALGKLVERGVVEEARRQGRRIVYRVKPGRLTGRA